MAESKPHRNWNEVRPGVELLNLLCERIVAMSVVSCSVWPRYRLYKCPEKDKLEWNHG